MSPTFFTVDVDDKHISRLFSNIDDPSKPIAEIIWNSLDADSDEINVNFQKNVAGGLDEIVVEDNGHGMDDVALNDSFKAIGKTLKAQGSKSPGGRFFHGKNGEGRYTAFSLGTMVEWHTVYATKSGKREFSLQANKAQGLRRLTFSKVDMPSLANNTGVQVTIKNLSQLARDIDINYLRGDLIAIFAHYLKAYSHSPIKIRVDGEELKVNDACITQSKVDFCINREGTGEEIPITLSMYHWKQPGLRRRFFVGTNGIVIQEDGKTGAPNVKDFGHSIVIASPYFDTLEEKGMSLLLNCEDFYEGLEARVAGYFHTFVRKCLAQKASSGVDKIKKSGIYPYKNLPQSKVEEAERELFDIYTEAILSQPNSPLQSKTLQSQEFILNLLKNALESGPEQLLNIFENVLRLPKEQVDAFSELLQKNSLSNIIKIGNLITNRISFVESLRNLFTDVELKKRVKERAHLHKILESERWIFGEQYLLGLSDKSLKNILYKYCELRGGTVVDGESVNAEKLDDIPDLYFYRSFPRSENRFENLIVELKRPSKVLSLTEFNQIQKYATTVAQDQGFDKKKTKWRFYLLGDKVSDEINLFRRQGGMPRNCILYRPNELDLEVYVFEWGEMFHDIMTTYSFLKEKLDEFDGVEYIQETYKQYMPEIKKQEM